jgi:hypothetical protein
MKAGRCSGKTRTRNPSESIDTNAVLVDENGTDLQLTRLMELSCFPLDGLIARSNFAAEEKAYVLAGTTQG